LDPFMSLVYMIIHLVDLARIVYQWVKYLLVIY